jgi:hypothetical protein
MQIWACLVLRPRKGFSVKNTGELSGVLERVYIFIVVVVACANTHHDVLL